MTLLDHWRRFWAAPVDTWLEEHRPQQFGYHFNPGMGATADEALQARAAERRIKRERALLIVHSQHARPDRERPRMIRGGRDAN